MSSSFTKTKAAADGVAIVSILVAVLTIGGEEWAPLKDFLKNIFTHHWLGKSVIAGMAFAAVFVIQNMFEADEASVSRSIMAASVSMIVSSCAIIGFFVLHTMGYV
jgi:hypothetical protein